MKKNKHIIILLILVTALVIFEHMAPKQPDWKPSFKRYDKIPFGSYIMYDLLPDIFPKSRIEPNDSSLYLKFSKRDYSNTSYIIITQSFDPQHVTLEQLLSFVEQGNKAFIAAEFFGKKFSDTLNLQVDMFFDEILRGDSLPYYFKNRNLEPDSAYWMKSSWSKFYFSSVDTSNTKAIATIGKKKVNYIRMKYGEGEFFIHNQPYAFTNYNLLFKNNARYAFGALSYLDNPYIIWDDNFKPGQKASTPLRYILSQKALRAAWYLILVLAILFMIFGAKRVQRVIPMVSPPENSSLEFAKTLGNLYMNSKNHKGIAKKKYAYWLDFLREKYYIIPENPDELDFKKVSEKTGVSEDLILSILYNKQAIDKSQNISAEQLLTFNRLIEKFHAVRM